MFRLAAALAALALLTACTGPSPQEERMDAASTLAARPTSEEMTGRYEEMQQRIRDALDAELGPFGWSLFREAAESTCGSEFSGAGGRNVAMGPWGFEDNIPDDRWPRARQIAADIAAEYGFVTAGLQVDEPGRHSSNGVDETLGAQYRFGTNVNTTLQVTTGCHLPASSGR
jgi:hypothetical protein